MRIDPEPEGSELTLLVQYLDYQRETVLAKTEGLVPAQMVQRNPPSALTLAGLLYHLALVEESWLEVRFSGLPERAPWGGVDWEADPDWEFRTAEGVDPEQLRERYREACERSRSVVSVASGPDQIVRPDAPGRSPLLTSMGLAPPHRRDRSPCGPRRHVARGHRRRGRRVGAEPSDEAYSSSFHFSRPKSRPNRAVKEGPSSRAVSGCKTRVP